MSSEKHITDNTLKNRNRHLTKYYFRVYFKRGVQPKCGVQVEKYGVQD